MLTIEELPPGWTGKTHALHRAVAEASGEWLWFLDADTLHAPDGLSILMEYGRAEGAAMVSLLPELRCETFWERVVQPLGGIVLMQSFPLHVVHRDDSPLAFANGQYILIRRDAYDDAGGHEAVKDRFVEDIALADRVKRKGYRIRVALIRGIVTCRMYASLGAARPGLEPDPLRRPGSSSGSPGVATARRAGLLPGGARGAGGEPGPAGAGVRSAFRARRCWGSACSTTCSCSSSSG